MRDGKNTKLFGPKPLKSLDFQQKVEYGLACLVLGPAAKFLESGSGVLNH
jgi:hypothetical protein